VPRTHQQQIETLEAQVADLRERMASLESQVSEGDQAESEVGAAPARSVRRATARRASRRRAQARALQPDTRAAIVEFLAKHPGSTAGEVAKGLDLNRSTVSSRVAQLLKLGQILKAERGYTAKPEPPAR
jgi:DNA-binding transcriptional ArsR family regulator